MGQRLSPKSTDKNTAKIIELRNAGQTWEQIASACNVTKATARYRYNTYGKEPTPELPDPIADRVAEIVREHGGKPEDVSADGWLSMFERAQQDRMQTGKPKHTTSATIRSSEPIALCFTSDWHLGSMYCNHEQFRKDYETIRADSRVYVGIGGDPFDGFPQWFKEAQAPANALHPVNVQLRATRAILKELERSVVAVIGGNHNEMISKKVGFSLYAMILEGMKFPYMPEGGLLKLKVGKVEYKILWKHQYRFNSSLNQFNTHHRMLEMLAPDVDMVVTEHEHNPGVESIEKYAFDQRRTVVNIRTGTYKEDDPYSMRFFKQGQVAPQTVILWPDSKKILAMHGRDSLRDAQTYLDGLKCDGKR